MSNKKFLNDIKDFIFPDCVSSTNIYFIVTRIHKNNQWINRVKIGVTNNIKKRMSTMQTGNPYPLNLWYSFKIDSSLAFDIEKKLHDKFRWSRTTGEWFKIHPCITEWITEHKKACLHTHEPKRGHILVKRQVFLI